MDYIWMFFVDIFLYAIGKKALKKEERTKTPEQRRKSLIINWIIALLLIGGLFAFTVIYS